MSISAPDPSEVSESNSLGSAVGVNESHVVVGGDGGVVINPAVNATTNADASAVTGSVVADSQTDVAAGIRRSDIQVGGNANVAGSVLADTTSASNTTSGNAQALSILGDPVRETLPENFFGSQYLTPANGSSLYSSDLFDAAGGIVNRDGSIIAGANATVTGLAGTAADPTSTLASASTTTGSSDALSLLPTQFGVSLDKLSIGSEGNVEGRTYSNQDATSSSTTGDSSAQSLNLQSAGIRISDASATYDSSGGYGGYGGWDHIDPLPFTIGTNGTIEGVSSQLNSASASTVSGDSIAQVGGIQAIRDSSGASFPASTQFATGVSLPGSIEPSFINTPTVGSIDGSGTSFVGEVIESIVNPSGASGTRPIPSGARIGGNLDLTADASVVQEATAATTSGNALASATGSNLDASGLEVAFTRVSGLTGNLSVHGSGSTNFDANGYLQGSAFASTTTGDARAINGNELAVPNPDIVTTGSYQGGYGGEGVTFPSNVPLQFNLVTGVGDGLVPSKVVVGSSLANGASFGGELDLTASSLTTTGNTLASNAGRVFGSKGVSFDIGENIEGRPASFEARAFADTDAVTTTAGAEGALAQTQIQAAGFSGPNSYYGAPTNAIEVGGNGDLGFLSTIDSSTTASAVTAGTTSPSYDPSGVGVKADSVVLSAGYAPKDFGFLSPIYGTESTNVFDPETYFDQMDYGSSSNNLFIGGSGDVTAESYTRNQTSASNVSGGVEAFSQNASTGMLLVDSDVSIGDTGNVAGVSGIWPSFTEASTTSGTAEASNTTLAQGILGGTPYSRSSVVAGPNGGSITGAAEVGLRTTSASSVSGDALAQNDASTSGLSNLYLTAGQVGGTGSSITGAALSTFETLASTTTGNADAFSDATSTGITNSQLNVNGNVSAISQLSNTVVASTMTGNAMAVATGHSAGLDGSPVHIAGNGTISASASSVISASSNTVSGTTSSYAYP
jgi:hypothetical protein